METLAYLYLELAYEAPVDADTVHGQNLKHGERRKGQRLISKASIQFHLLSLSLPLAFLFVIGRAQAMKLEDQGSQVSALQNNLKTAAYYNGPVTGYYGQQTEAAVKQFQEARGLIADGVAGEATLAALQRYLDGTSTGSVVFSVAKRGLRMGDRGSEVKEIQQRLKSTGFDPGSIDEKFGFATEEAVKQFQATRGLHVDGIVGAETWFALRCLGSSISGYQVIVTPGSADTLNKVLTYVPNAYVDQSSLRLDIRAGGFPNYSSAQKQAEMLRSHGLNAQVVYIHSTF